VNAETPISVETKAPRWRRKLSVVLRRRSTGILYEIAAASALVLTVAISAFIVFGSDDPAPLTPAVAAILLVINLVPAMALMVLVARRIAMKRAGRSIVGRGSLHVRLVALFSVIASVPMLLVVVFASGLFQFGVEFWSSDRARGMIENAAVLGQQLYDEELARVDRETVTMASDLANVLDDNAVRADRLQSFFESTEFQDYLARQTLYRNLSEVILVSVSPDQQVRALALVNPYDRDNMASVVTPPIIRALRSGTRSVVVRTPERVGAVTPLAEGSDIFLYGARVHDPLLVDRVQRAQAIVGDYQALIARSRVLQLRFNAALLLISLIILGVTIWIALRLADRLVRPVGDLVDAARRVTAGELSARVPASNVRDEVATLGNAFNRMTRRLEEQRGELVSANALLDSRRAFTEAVLSGVTAGVIRVDEDRVVRLINSSAEALLGTGDGSAVGQRLADLAPELDRQLESQEREEIIQVALGGETRTLAVKTVKVEGGHVLTFDDITDQLIDQRRAAWSDVARRIAHEIKNPLTPIQLAAERLQRRYAAEIKSDAGTFERLTSTIIRQVGDLRRMVDEFSSFARMPKPVFREEAIVDVARQAIFLHEVAHPEIDFSLEAPDPSPLLVCDRRLLGQALTNVVKNAVEAIQQRAEERGENGDDAAPATPRGGYDRITVRISEDQGELCIEIVDSGIGLPADRKNLTEPYMTTRAKGTGLGLAIVKKIVEEHLGRIDFADAPGGGTRVRICFEPAALARHGAGQRYSEELHSNG
jgi:two-component system nitrogen regulation sensor histidine kinase NtrY